MMDDTPRVIDFTVRCTADDIVPVINTHMARQRHEEVAPLELVPTHELAALIEPHLGTYARLEHQLRCRTIVQLGKWRVAADPLGREIEGDWIAFWETDGVHEPQFKLAQLYGRRTDLDREALAAVDAWVKHAVPHDRFRRKRPPDEVKVPTFPRPFFASIRHEGV